MKYIPKLSILMPILNEESNLPRCLAAIVAQNYPNEAIEILVADGGSTDRSLEILREFSHVLNITVLDNSVRREAEWGKALAFESASGDYVLCVDADMWPSSPNLFTRLTEVLETRKDLAGVAVGYHTSNELSIWSRYLSCDEFQRDPLFQALTPNMDKFVTEKCSNYDVCTFLSPRVPPMGQTTMYRRQDIDLKWWGGSYNDIDIVAHLVSSGNRHFGYIRDVGWIHEHCVSLRHMLRKRRRNMLQQSNSYISTSNARDFVWLDTTNLKEIMSVIVHVIQANLIVPEFCRGLRDSIRSGHANQLLRPIVSATVTDVLLWDLLKSPDGRKLFRKFVSRQPIHDNS